MKRIYLLLITLLVLTSCSINSEVEIVLKQRCRYSSATSQKIWYTLVYTSGDKAIKKHITGDSFKLVLPQNKTTYIALYPLGNSYPLTGVRSKREKIVYLSYDYTQVIQPIIDLVSDFPKQVSSSNFDKIKKLYDKSNVKSLEKRKFVYDFLYNRLNENSFINTDPWWIDVGLLSEGTYICDHPDIENIVVTNTSVSNTVLLSPGVYRYINEDKKLKLEVFVNDLDQISKGKKGSAVLISGL